MVPVLVDAVEMAPEPPTGLRLFSLDERGMEADWLAEQSGDPGPDGALCALVEREPTMMLAAYEIAMAHLWATGELYKVRDLDGEPIDRDPLHVTLTIGAVLDGISVWRRIPWEDVQRLAATAVRWVHPPNAERAWQEERRRKQAERREAA